jgi:diguanylate cyclase (GGDEF)-like protein/PAS domain S-box-containing protein
VSIPTQRFKDLNDLHLARAVDNAGNPILIVDKGACIVYCNRAYAALCGVPASSLVGKPPTSLRPSRERAKEFSRMWSRLLAGETWFGELQELDSKGAMVDVEAVISPLMDPSGKAALFMMLEHDITQRKAEYRSLWETANHDRLTGLANRGLFGSLLEHSIERSRRGGARMALLYIDLDGFKGVNDTLGHDAGDAVLVEAARILSACVRKSDVAARLGGDEFCCILNNIDSADSASKIAQQIIDSISIPMQIDGNPVKIGASIGIALFPDHPGGAEEIKRAADQAMYVAKRSGKNCWAMAPDASGEPDGTQ